MPAKFEKRLINLPKETKKPIPLSHTTRSQAQALAPPQGAPAPPPAENYEANPPQGNPLTTGWINAITNLLGFPLTSETGQKLQKWVLYKDFFNLHLVLDIFGNYCLLQTQWVPTNLVKQLVGLRNYMLILMDKSRPTDQHEK